MRKTKLLAVLFFLFLAFELKAAIDPEFDVPKYVTRSKPKHISKEDAVFLFKNQNEQLVVTFVERERDFGRFLNLPIFPKKAWNVRYEQIIKFDGEWNILYKNEVSRELAKNQISIWIFLSIWIITVFYLADLFSGNGFFGKKSRTEYNKITLGAGISFLIVVFVFSRIIFFLGVIDSNIAGLIAIASLWGIFVIQVMYWNYKIPIVEKKSKSKPIGV